MKQMKPIRMESKKRSIMKPASEKMMIHRMRIYWLKLKPGEKQWIKSIVFLRASK